jgi:hypothetical protein
LLCWIVLFGPEALVISLNWIFFGLQNNYYMYKVGAEGKKLVCHWELIVSGISV